MSLGLKSKENNETVLVSEEESNILSYTYPCKTAGSDAKNGNYYHSLSKDSFNSLNVLRRWASEQNVDMTHLVKYSLHDDLTFLRYLRANGMNTDKAIVHMKKNIEYRKTMNVDEILSKLPEQK